MDWIKNAWLDIAVTGVMVLATLVHMEWAWWVIAVYTPFMLLLKVVAFTNRHSHSKIKPTESGVPKAVYHTLYGANVLLAAYDRWWWIVGCWAAIWILSVVSDKASGPKS
ncbi:MAG: hypothetical protein WBW88_16860 [Rhodothermales bacterium]|jgi:hypothetical protein